MIVLTTPTGGIGRQVLTRLLDQDEPLRVIVRDPARLPAAARDRVEVVPGSHGDAEVVDRAFAGADAVFWLAPPNPSAASTAAPYVDFSRPASEALRRHRVPRVVGVSALGRGFPGAETDAGLVSATLAMDDLIAATGVAYRALALPGFMDNVLWQVESIKAEGVFSSPLGGDRRVPTCATRDIAAVAARLLVDRSWGGVDRVPVLGPEDVSGQDMARVMSEVLGRPVHHRQVPVDAFRSGLLAHGHSEAMAQGMVDMLTAKDRGMDNVEPRTPASSSPTGFRQWCEEVLKPAVLA